MRKLAIIVVLLLTVAVAQAQVPKLGVGAFGGVSLPIAQQDQAKGSEFGLRARLSLLPFLSGEAQLAFTKWGKPDPINGVTMPDGSKVTELGINGVLGGGAGMGIKPFFVAGFGSYKVKNDATKDEFTRMGYSAGLGLGIGVIPKINIDARAEAVVIPMAEGGSKKAIKATVGFFFNF